MVRESNREQEEKKKRRGEKESVDMCVCVKESGRGERACIREGGRGRGTRESEQMRYTSDNTLYE